MFESARHRQILGIAVLTLSVLVVSGAAIGIRIAQAEGVPSLSIAAWRLTFAVLVLWLLMPTQAAARTEIARLSREAWWGAALAGVFLAAHFAAWIASLGYTSVASSTALVTTNPIWIALISWWVWRERITPAVWFGMLAAIGGSILIFLSDAQLDVERSGGAPLLGNALALLGSLTVSGYLLLGRRLRADVSLLPYVLLVYSSSALTLLVAAVLFASPLSGFSTTGWACLAGLALGPQLLGHTGINWALKHLPATVIAIAILGEPVGSALLAWIFFGERFAWLQLCGFALLLVGIYLALRASATAQARHNKEVVKGTEVSRTL